ncbi:hypothetical protein JRQ81_009577 [Phrynocephalus forsythii]|uniref:Transmembrane protein 154 n=1 Tax=Phrynocephalus forsythii TaxID=171643 RepID=A0A9Q1AS13_9SAUR|nr:hypothetical protein JRQ81_009577 [Phrynocephalus forsythii]
MGRWWWWWWQRLWVVALLPLPALQADFVPIKHLNMTDAGALGTTALLGNGPTPNTPGPPSARGQETERTPLRTTEWSTVETKTNSPLLSPGSLAAIYLKYLIPSVVAVILLLFLFAMYRRKKAIRGSRSRTVSINESLDSDDDGYTAAARRSFPPEAFAPIPEETLQTTEALTSVKGPEIPETPDQLPSRE